MPRYKAPEILRSEVSIGSTLKRRRMRETRPFSFTQGRESFDLAQDRESFDLAQNRELVERHVERQMGVFQQPVKV
jgi:hypothetical protein